MEITSSPTGFILSTSRTIFRIQVQLGWGPRKDNEVAISRHTTPRKTSFKYLGSTILEKQEIDDGIMHCIWVARVG